MAGLLDSILQLVRGQQAGQPAIPAALSGAITAGGNNAAIPAPAIPIPGMDEGSNMTGLTGSNPIPAVLKTALAPPPPPQLTPRTGFFDGATPAAGQPYQPAGMMDKISRVAGLVGGVAKAVAPYAGEGARQLQASQFNDEQALAQAREARAGQQQQFEQGIQGQQEGRAEQAFPLAQQAEQQKIANTRTPEQTAEINSNEVEATPLGQFFKVNKFKGTASPVTMEDTPGTPLQTTPKSTRYSVEMDKQDRPVAVVDQFTKQRYMGNDPNLPPEARQLMEGYAQSHAAAIKEKYDNEDRLNAHSDARQARSFAQADARQQKSFQHQIDTMNAQHDFALNKPTDPEKNRADLANNLLENASSLEDIVNRRPDLFGKMSGRLTTVRSFIGTNDPDISQLKNIKHNLGIVVNSAHGMRSGRAIQAAADSLANTNWQDGPDAIKAAINAARSSVNTFQQTPEQQHGSLLGHAPAAATAPTGATHEVYVGGKLAGHVVNNQYVPLGNQ